jgi:hypothetical protein
VNLNELDRSQLKPSPLEDERLNRQLAPTEDVHPSDALEDNQQVVGAQVRGLLGEIDIPTPPRLEDWINLSYIIDVPTLLRLEDWSNLSYIDELEDDIYSDGIASESRQASQDSNGATQPHPAEHPLPQEQQQNPTIDTHLLAQFHAQANGELQRGPVPDSTWGNPEAIEEACLEGPNAESSPSDETKLYRCSICSTAFDLQCHLT